MLHAMETVGLKGKTGLVSGSSKQPWIEAIALHAGAAKVHILSTFKDPFHIVG